MVAKSSHSRVNGNSMSKVDITDVADWFLCKESMTHKKLQKLCYYAVAWGWVLMKDSIATNDRFEAWVHGPVSPLLYEKYKNNGWNSISKPSKVKQLPGDLLQVLEAVWVTYGDKGGNELEALSHIEQPWQNARVGVAPSERGDTEISVDDMTKFYSSIYQGDA